MGAHVRRRRRVQPALKLAGSCVTGAVILLLVVSLIGGYRYTQHWTSAIAARRQGVLGRRSAVRRSLVARWQDTWPQVRVAGGLALFAGVLVAWLGVLVGANWQLVWSVVLAVGLVVFLLIYLLLRSPDAW